MAKWAARQTANGKLGIDPILFFSRVCYYESSPQHSPACLKSGKLTILGPTAKRACVCPSESACLELIHDQRFVDCGTECKMSSGPQMLADRSLDRQS